MKIAGPEPRIIRNPYDSICMVGGCPVFALYLLLYLLYLSC